MSFGSLAPDSVVGPGGRPCDVPPPWGPEQEAKCSGSSLCSGLAQSRLLMSCEQPWASRAWGGGMCRILCRLWVLGHDLSQSPGLASGVRARMEATPDAGSL